MGYREEIVAGYTFVTLTLHETCPGPGCGRLTQAHVRFVQPSGTKGPHIKAFCSECGFRRELSLRAYGPILRSSFPEIDQYIDLTKPKNRSKSYDAGSPEFFATFGWCCIYCEGSRLAREYRLKQIESLETSEIENEISAEFEDFNPAFETKASDLGKTGRALQNIFDLVPDHLFPVWIQNLPDLPWESEGKQKAERVWVASAHRSCNSRRKKRLENVDFLLFVYSRFIFPALRLSEKEKVLDMLAFAEVLRQLELYKERHQLAELKPDRRAM